MIQPTFPNDVWNGESETRSSNIINRPPDTADWNRIVAELRATQILVLTLQNKPASTFLSIFF